MERKKYKKIPEKYLSRSGENHWNYKGDRVGYVALHEWIYKRLGKPNKCEICGVSKIPKNKKVWFHWASKDKKYNRDVSKWWSLCIPCHRKFDGWQEKIQSKFRKSKCWEKRTRNKKGQFTKK